MRVRILPYVAVVSGVIIACDPGSLEGLEVRLQAVETGSVKRAPALITTGIPFARGAVRDISILSVKHLGRSLPAQFTRLVPWDDGSVRWALMDVQLDVPPGGKAELTVSDDKANVPPPLALKIEEDTEVVRVTTGSLRFSVSKRKPGIFESVSLGAVEVLRPAGRGLVVWDAQGKEIVAGPPSSVKVEQWGPLRCVICAKGRFPGVHNGLLGYTVRISAFAGQRIVKLHVWLENHGAMGYFSARSEGEASPSVEWFPFDGMAVELALSPATGLRALCEGVEASDNLKVLQICKKTPKPLARNERPVPPFYTWDCFEYTIRSGEQELKKGDRTEGVVVIKSGVGTLTVGIRDFWQNYEKAIELVSGGTLRLWLWPQEGQWPRQKVNAPYDRSLDGVAQDGMYVLPGGVHKGHEFVLDLSGRDARETWAELVQPLVALPSAEYCAGTEAVPGLFAPPGVRTGDRDCDAKLAAWERMAASVADPSHPAGLYAAQKTSWFADVGYMQDSGYWFGWMDYGDIPVPGRGPVGLHYDWPWILLVNLLRTGNPNFFYLAVPMARHRIDVDQLWSDRDPPDCAGLQRGDYNWPNFHCMRLYRKPQVTSNFLRGLVLYYMLTGEPKALECCLRNGEGLRAAWDWIARNKPYGGPQGDMAANAWSIESYLALGTLTTDKKWFDSALELFNTNVVPKWKGYGPFLHDPRRQIQSQDYIQEDMKYCYAIAAFCTLHHFTGDETVFRLLREGCENQFPESFFDAPMFLSDLYGYVGLKTGNASHLSNAAAVFAQGFPESKCPPVFLPENSVWSRTSAMMLRTGHILQYAWWKKVGTPTARSASR
ncbi:MAG: hypothetical protein N2255_01605 [Kiritimatiellae bacterium]|nr:hypothetical protein [Kiritimatiellia bacterium]